MKIFIHYLRTYLKDNFRIKAHVLIGLFLAVSIYLNYTYGIYNNYFKVQNNSEIGVLKLWGLYVLAFLIPLIILAIFQKGKKSLFNIKFLIFGLFALFLMTLDSSYYLLKYLTVLLPKDATSFNFYSACVSNLLSAVTIMLPLFIIYKSTKYFSSESYGLTVRGANLKPYLMVVAIIVPAVFILAATQDDFTKYYPTYKPYRYRMVELPELIKIALFEFCYGFDFINVELIFRGFMVVGLSRFVGKDAILPMVSCYVFLHFGKPMAEAIISIFGGLGLGIAAYKSRNITGGILVHLSVAWGMELAAYLFK